MTRPRSLFVLLALALLSACNVKKADIGKLCDAELLSKSSLKTSRSQLFSWMESNVASSEAVILVRELEAKDAHGISARLKDEARQVGLPSCTFADQAELEAKDDDSRTDLANLCAGSAAKSDGSIARLEILGADDAERMREMLDWTSANAKSSDTTALVQKIAALPPKQRGALLRAEAAKVGTPSCLLASTLDAPPPAAAPPPASAEQGVSPGFVVTKVDGLPKNQVVIAKALVDAGGAINACYGAALATTPTLSGKVIVKLTLDATGKVTNASAEGSNLKGAILPCIGAAVSGVSLPGPPPDVGKKGTKAAATLQLSPGASGMSATIDPGWLAKASKRK